MMGGYGMMAGLGWLGVLTMIIFWVGLLTLVVWGLSNLVALRRTTAEPDAIEIARRRYARGEISREEYQQTVATLSGRS